MNKLIIPKGCVIQGQASAISNEGDIDIENTFIPQVLHSDQGGIRIICPESETTCDKIVAENGMVEVEANAFNCTQLTAQAASLRTGNFTVGQSLICQAEVFLEAKEARIENCSADKIDIAVDSYNGQTIVARTELVLKGNNIKLERISAPRVVIKGNVQCKMIDAAESVVVESGRIAIKSLNCPRFHAAPEVTGIVMVANSEEVKAEGVRGFLHPSELGMLADGDDVVSIPTADLSTMAIERDPEPGPPVSFSEPEPPQEPEETTLEEPEAPSYDEPEVPSFEVPEVPSYDEPEASSFEEPETPSFDEQETASLDELETPSLDEPETPSFEVLEAADDLTSEDTYALGEAESLDTEFGAVDETPEEDTEPGLDNVSFDDLDAPEMPTAELSPDEYPDELTPEDLPEINSEDLSEMEQVETDDLTEELSVDDLEEADEVDDFSSTAILMAADGFEDDDDDDDSLDALPEISGLGDDILDPDSDAIAENNPYEVDDPLDELNVADDVIEDDELTAEDLEAMEDEFEDDTPDNPEEALADELTNMLAKIKSYFPADNIPNSIAQIQRYIDERRFSLFAKARNKEAVISNFDKFEHREISQLVRVFFDRLEAYVNQ